MRRPFLSILVITMVIAGTGAAAARAQDAAELQARFTAQLDRRRDDLIEVRRDLHRHPEVSGEEERTAGVVAERLRALGLTVRTGIGGHGVVALLQGARPGPVVAFRADMDAVHSDAPDPVPFASENPGVRHVCGHDIHTTIGLALAEGLVAVREQLPGSVMLIFQPAEENATGARAMIADGVFGDVRPAAIFAYHAAPFPVGQLATAWETLMAGRDRVRVTVTGSGDLESAAEEVRSRIESVGTISPQQAAQPMPLDFIFAQVGQPSQSDVGTVSVEAWITTASFHARAQARRQIEGAVADVRLDGVTVQLDYGERWIAGVTNDAELVRQATRSASSVAGSEAILMLYRVYPGVSEDFGFF
ncbi:MAG: amidohydrolase, partial [Gemmatimonadales bacterium]|nr:amidohydrolase [Gemmatimonadales bacterium]